MPANSRPFCEREMFGEEILKSLAESLAASVGIPVREAWAYYCWFRFHRVGEEAAAI